MNILEPFKPTLKIFQFSSVFSQFRKFENIWCFYGWKNKSLGFEIIKTCGHIRRSFQCCNWIDILSISKSSCFVSLNLFRFIVRRNCFHLLYRSSRDKVLILWDLVKNVALRTVPTYECIEALVGLPFGEPFPELNIKESNQPHVITAGDKGSFSSGFQRKLS